jgi:hypothetical protein
MVFYSPKQKAQGSWIKVAEVLSAKAVPWWASIKAHGRPNPMLPLLGCTQRPGFTLGLAVRACGLREPRPLSTSLVDTPSSEGPESGH